MQRIKEGTICFLTQEEGGRKSPPTDLIYYPTTIVDNKPWSIVIFFDESLQKEQYIGLCKVTFRMDWAPFDILEEVDELPVYEGSKLVGKIIFNW